MVERTTLNRVVVGSIPTLGAIRYDSMSEWLRRKIRNLLGFARAGSNPVTVVLLMGRWFCSSVRMKFPFAIDIDDNEDDSLPIHTSHFIETFLLV